jgi:HK97 family phage prohead protease
VSEILIRSFTLERATAAGDGRTLVMRAVPYEHIIDIGPGTREVFSQGAFDQQVRGGASAAGRVRLTLNHPKPTDLLTNSLIGSLISMDDRPDGLHVEARMASTTVANEALALVNDGLLDQVSIGFLDQGTVTSKTDDGSKLLRRQRAHMDHLALLAGNAAYGDGSKVLAVRDEQTGPTLAELRPLQLRLR